VATWHKRSTCIALSHEADLTVVAVGGWCGDGRDDGFALASASSAEVSLLRHLCFVRLSILLMSRVFQSCVFPVPRFQRPRKSRVGSNGILIASSHCLHSLSTLRRHVGTHDTLSTCRQCRQAIIRFRYRSFIHSYSFIENRNDRTHLHK